jgi:hypothetical protein
MVWKMMDSHLHLQDDAFNEDRPEVILRAASRGVALFVCNGSTPQDWPRVAALASADRRVIPFFGLHPWYTKDFGREGWLPETQHCPLARRLRKRLRGLTDDLGAITCVYSIEPLDDAVRAAIGPEDQAEELESHGRGRRPLGSLPTMTGIFGLTCAHVATRMLLAKRTSPGLAGPAKDLRQKGCGQDGCALE